MSYMQILRRINRILKSTIHDVMDNLTKDEADLHDFDERLHGEARGSERASSDSSSSRQSSSSNRYSTSGQQQSAKQQGTRKPGERDDAYYYAVLGLTPGASIQDIKKAYRKLMSQYHPDRVATLSVDLQKEAAERSKAINEAYHIIERRRNFK